MTTVRGKSDVPIGKIEIRGVPAEVFARLDGDYVVVVDGRRYVADTLTAAKSKASRELAKSKVEISVPFCEVFRNKARHGVIYGQHASNGNTLVRWADGRTEQFDHWQREVYVPLTDAQAVELERLRAQKKTADQALSDFEKPLKFNVHDAVRAAIGQAVSDADREGRAL